MPKKTKIFQFEITTHDGLKERSYTEYLRAPNQMIANSKARSYERDFGDDGERTIDASGKKIYCSEAFDWWISKMPTPITEIEIMLIDGEMLIFPIPQEV